MGLPWRQPDQNPLVSPFITECCARPLHRWFPAGLGWDPSSCSSNRFLDGPDALKSLNVEAILHEEGGVEARGGKNALVARKCASGVQ